VQRAGANDEKVAMLLDKLELRGPTAFDSFVSALKETEQEHAAAPLTEPDVGNQQLQLSPSSRAPDGNVIF